MNENREWLNFRQYKRKPMEFLARIEEYIAKHRGNRWVNNRELLDESFREMTDHWWMANRSEIEDYQQFKSLFKAKYWSETTQNLIPVSYTHLWSILWTLRRPSCNNEAIFLKVVNSVSLLLNFTKSYIIYRSRIILRKLTVVFCMIIATFYCKNEQYILLF